MCADYGKLLLKISAVLFPAFAFPDFSGSNYTSPGKVLCGGGEGICFLLIICKQVQSQPTALPMPGGAAVGSECGGKPGPPTRLLIPEDFQENPEPRGCLGRVGEVAWPHSSPLLLHAPAILSVTAPSVILPRQSIL